jgi:hypothetical protein
MVAQPITLQAAGRAAASALAVGGLALAGCAANVAHSPGTGDSSVSPAPAIAAAPRGARHYEVDADRTQLTLLVGRAGALSKLGHDHVIRSDAERGAAWIAADGRSCGLELRVPVRSLVVDDPSARAAAGPDFTAAVPDDARAGTRDNMTGERVLDADSYPEIVVRYTGEVPLAQSAPLRVTVELRGRTHVLDVPTVVTHDPREIAASGETRVLQTTLGLEPFSILGGAIAVADEVTVRFELVARSRD